MSDSFGPRHRQQEKERHHRIAPRALGPLALWLAHTQPNHAGHRQQRKNPHRKPNVREHLVEVTGTETTNCQLTGQDETDFHLGIGFDATEAQRLRQDPHPDKATLKRLQQISVVVEMTPHYRARYHPAWTSDAVAAVVGRQVKVAGQLMVDNEHVNAKDNCAHPEADTTKRWRASAWEVHPVIQFSVCDSETPCSADSSDWKALDDLP